MSLKKLQLYFLAILLLSLGGCAEEHDTVDVSTLQMPCHNHDHEAEIDPLWSGAEHVELGTEGFMMACAELNLSDCPVHEIFREDKKLKFNYGQLVSLADFYKTAEKAFAETQVYRGLKRVFKCFDKAGKVHVVQETEPNVEYPSCAWSIAFSGTPFLKVLVTNENHFGWYNIVEYIRIHQQAIDFALEAYDLKQQGMHQQAEELFNLALFYNGFADHYLTDSFSAGHVRVPRKQLRDWAKENLKFWLRRYVGDALGNLYHDLDGKDRNGDEVGLPVKNSLDESWLTHSDSHLHHLTTSEDPGVLYPTQAVSLSVQEVLLAYEEGIEPEGVFQALYKVPFADDLPMAEKFKLSGDKKADKKWLKVMRKALAAPLRLITSKKSIKKSVQALDDIMAMMRRDVEQDLQSNPQLQLRMPEVYIENYKNIR